MRIASLLPAATEMVAALGGAGQLVAISHECDYPSSVQHLPRVTVTSIDAEASSARIDAEVRRLREAGRPVIAVDGDQLGRLAPDLILTQDLCEVCAVADGEVHRLAAALRPAPAMLSLQARTLQGIWDDVRRVAKALELDAEAEELILGLQSRLRRLRPGPGRKPRVLCIEWLDPLYLAGHWVPEMIAAAGGEDVGAAPGSHSTRRNWEAIPALRPEIAVVMLCGFDLERGVRELNALAGPEADTLRGVTVWVLDANAYSSRPGPRVVDGVERLQAALQGREIPGVARWQQD